MERVLTPSLSIIYPLTQKISKKVFLHSFYPFLYWIKEKSVASLAYRNIYKQKTKTIINNRFCHCITELATLLGKIKVGFTLGSRSFLKIAFLFALPALPLRVLLGYY